MSNDNRLLGTILKAGKVLDLFTLEKPEWGVSEVAEILSLPKSSSCQLLATLTEIGLLRQTNGNRYQLGWRLVSFARILLESTAFRIEAIKVMDDLAARYRQSVYLATLDGDDVVCVTNLDGELKIANLEERLYIHSSAVGKMLVSGSPWEEVQSIIEKSGMPALTKKTIINQDIFRDEISKVRRQGYASTIEETMPNLCCLAAPIYDFDGKIIASMSISVPNNYFKRYEKELIKSIRSSCREVSKELGCLSNELPIISR